ncbi:MAG: hypothetical protein WBV89_05890 [Ilumatobacter sp.]
MEVDAELGDELGGQFGVVDRVDRPDDFFRVPGGADFAFRVAGLEQSDQFRVGIVVEALVRDGHQFSDPVERIGLATACRARDHLPDQAELTPRSEAPDVGVVGDDFGVVDRT